MALRLLTKHIGVYQRKSQVRIFGGKPDVCFDIAYKYRGKLIWEKVGWVSEGYTARMAVDIRGERIRSIRHGLDLPRQKPTSPLFRDVMVKYLQWAAVNKKNGKKTDEYLYRKHLKCLDSKRLYEITPFDLEEIKTNTMSKGLSQATALHLLVLIGSVFNEASMWDLYKGDNPVKRVKKPSPQNRRERFLNYEEARLLLSELKKISPQLHDISLIALHCGLRAGEVFNLKGQDLDFNNKMIHIADPKNRHPRKAYMTEEVQAALSKRHPPLPGDLIFKAREGGPIKTVSRTFARITEQIGLNNGIDDPRYKVVFHTLRHTFASWLALNGETIQTIAELLGHRTLEMTQRYSHLTADHKKRAILAMEKLFKNNGQM
jgi:integrase